MTVVTTSGETRFTYQDWEAYFRVRGVDKLARRILVDGTALLVWCAYHRLYRAGGYDFCRFFTENRGYLRQSIQIAEGKPQGKVAFS